MDAGVSMRSRSPSRVYTSQHQRHQSMGGVAGGLSGGYGLFSPGTVISPFCWDTSALRFDFDDLRARSNLLSLSSDIRDAEETEILRRASEAELEGTGPFAGSTGKYGADNEGAYDGEWKAGRIQKRKGGTVPVAPEVEMKRFKLAVLRNLLANFSLEKTIDKYRNLSSKPFTVRPSDYSFDCSVSAHQLKDKLFRLTGSDRIKINDRQFVQRMQKILEHEDQERMKKADEERAEREFQRLRKLMQHGVISAKELQDDECLMAVQASAAAAKNRKSAKTQRNRKGTATHSNHRNSKIAPQKRSSARNKGQSTISSSMTTINRRPEDRSRNSVRLPAISSHSQSTIANANFSSFTIPSPKRAASHVYTSDYPSDTRSGCANGPTRHPATHEPKHKTTEPHLKNHREDNNSTAEEDRCSSSLPAIRSQHVPGSTTRYEHPLIQEMRQEKSVKGLYELAAKLSTMSL